MELLLTENRLHYDCLALNTNIVTMCKQNDEWVWDVGWPYNFVGKSICQSNST